MIKKTNSILKSFIKFIFFGDLHIDKKENFMDFESPKNIRYYMTSVFPDKQTKDDILKSISR